MTEWNTDIAKAPRGKFVVVNRTRGNAKTLRANVIAYMAEHPEATAPECAAALGETTQAVRNAAKDAVEFRTSRDGSSLRARIEALRREHPDWTIDQAAINLDAKKNSLTAYASMLGFKWPRASRADGAPEPSAAPKQPEPENAHPALPVGPPEVSQPRTVRPLTGSKFYLVNDAGDYLNRYCAGFTKDKREAWVGNQQQLAGCRRNFAIARDLRERPVTKNIAVPVNREVA